MHNEIRLPVEGEFKLFRTDHTLNTRYTVLRTVIGHNWRHMVRIQLNPIFRSIHFIFHSMATIIIIVGFLFSITSLSRIGCYEVSG